MGTLRTLPEALAKAACIDAGYVFVEGGLEVRRSYAEIRETSLGVARALREAGLRSGDLVAIVVNDAEQFLTTLLGAAISGIVPASLYPPATSSDLPRYLELTAGILRTAGARAVVTSNGLVAAFEEMRPVCPDLRVVLSRDQLDAPAREPDSAPSLDDLAFVQFTSGSTSAPKGVALTHRNLSANIDAINGPNGLAVSADDLGVSWLPLYHDMGLVGMALGPIYCARPVVLLTPQAFVKRPADGCVRFPGIGDDQLRAEFRVRPVRAARQGSRSRGPGPLVLACGRLRVRADPRANPRGVRRAVPARRLPRNEPAAKLWARRTRARGDIRASQPRPQDGPGSRRQLDRRARGDSRGGRRPTRGHAVSCGLPCRATRSG
jgi:hypothetical protein